MVAAHLEQGLVALLGRAPCDGVAGLRDVPLPKAVGIDAPEGRA